MPKTKSENKAVELKMDDIDTQTNIIKAGIQLKILPAKRN